MSSRWRILPRCGRRRAATGSARPGGVAAGGPRRPPRRGGAGAGRLAGVVRDRTGPGARRRPPSPGGLTVEPQTAASGPPLEDPEEARGRILDAEASLLAVAALSASLEGRLLDGLETPQPAGAI